MHTTEDLAWLATSRRRSDDERVITESSPGLRHIGPATFQAPAHIGWGWRWRGVELISVYDGAAMAASGEVGRAL
jgi:hypothetical protein